MSASEPLPCDWREPSPAQARRARIPGRRRQAVTGGYHRGRGGSLAAAVAPGCKCHSGLSRLPSLPPGMIASSASLLGPGVGFAAVPFPSSSPGRCPMLRMRFKIHFTGKRNFQVSSRAIFRLISELRNQQTETVSSESLRSRAARASVSRRQFHHHSLSHESGLI